MKLINYLIIIPCCFLIGCSSVPKSELQNLPSLIEIMVIDFSQSTLKIRVSHRNQTTRVNNQLSCQLSLKDSNPIKFNEVPIPDLSTYAVETLDIDLTQSDLPTINNNHKEIPYVLDCFLFSENFRKEHLIKKATLYRVPGSRSEFR